MTIEVVTGRDDYSRWDEAIALVQALGSPPDPDALERLMAERGDIADELSLAAEELELEASVADEALEPSDEPIVSKALAHYMRLNNPGKAGPTLGDTFDRSGTSVAAVEAAGVLPKHLAGALVRGEVSEVGAVAVRALSRWLHRPFDSIRDACRASFQAGLPVEASAETAPTRRATTYAEFIAASDLSDAEKAAWLSEE